MSGVEWVPIGRVVVRLRPVDPAKMRRVLERMVREGHVRAESALGVTVIHSSEIPRLHLAAHDRGQDRRLKEL